jgi:ADP-ribosylglycohydrolase
MARACLTGGLVGAQVGLGAIPERFIQGLEGHDELVSLCKRLGELAER